MSEAPSWNTPLSDTNTQCGLPEVSTRNEQVKTAKEDHVPGIFVVAFVGKAFAFIVIVFILAVIGLFTLMKKAL